MRKKIYKNIYLFNYICRSYRLQTIFLHYTNALTCFIIKDKCKIGIRKEIKN